MCKRTQIKEDVEVFGLDASFLEVGNLLGCRCVNRGSRQGIVLLICKLVQLSLLDSPGILHPLLSFCQGSSKDLLPFHLGGSSPWSIKFSQIFCVCFIVFLYMSAGCVSTIRTCVQVYLEILRFVFCFLPSFHAL